MAVMFVFQQCKKFIVPFAKALLLFTVYII